MQDTITHFMWGYQRHFRLAVEHEAERILDSLKPGLASKAFLIGIRLDDEADLPPACVEPEIHHWAESSEFYDALGDVGAIQAAYPESRLSHSHLLVQDREDRVLFRRALRDAVVRRLEACRDRPQDLRAFVSLPVERDGFLVLTIITVIGSVFDDIPAVASESVRIHDYRSVRVPCSLVEAAIDLILARANQALSQSDAGVELLVLGSADQTIRQAAVTFFTGLLNRVDHDSIIVGTGASVFDILSRLAWAPYEKAEALGSLLFAQEAATIGTPVMTLAEPVPLKHAKALRKLLVLANDELVLRCDCKSAFALVRAPFPKPTERPNSVTVRITGRGKWAVSSETRDLMIMNDSLASLPQPVVDERRLARDLRRLIRSMTEANAATFAEIGAQLATSGHGGIVLVTEATAQEAVRLGNESLPIAPLELTPGLAIKLTEIDGALLCDPAGNCHAVGVILDGRASMLGDPGRGARLNSAIRYIASSSRPTAAMVVSEDGGLDLLPRLRSPIAKEELASRLDELRQLANFPQTPPDRDREVDVIDWMERHAFYLHEAQCESANEWIATCNAHFLKDSNVRIEQHPLRPHPEFDPARDLV